MKNFPSICVLILVCILTGCTSPVIPSTPPTQASTAASPSETPTQPCPTATHTPLPPITVHIDGARLILEKSPMIEDGIVFLPWQEVFNALRYTTYIYTEVNEPYIGGVKYKTDGSTTNFHLQLDTRDVLVDPGQATGKTVSLSAYPKVENGEVMIPLDVLSASLDAQVSYDAESGRVDIDTGRRVENLNLQSGSPFDAFVFQQKTSAQLEDSRITSLASGLSLVDFTREGEEQNSHINLEEITQCGMTRLNLTINNQDWEPENWDLSEFEIDPRFRPLYEHIKQSGVKVITYNLIFKDKDFLREGGKLGYPRFKNEAEIQRYLDYVRTTVRYFNGVVDAYEIWNEQNIQGTGQYIEPDDYIEVVKRVVPIIHQEDPAAKISVGQTTQFDDPASRDYTYRIIESDLMPLVDEVSVHTAYWDSPEHESEFYYAYADYLQKVKETAWAHGFTGEFIGEEGNFAPANHVPEDMKDRVPAYSMIKAGKYATRINIINLGLGFSGGIFGLGQSDGPAFTMVCNLNTVLAGAQPEDVEVEIQGDAEKLAHYGFALPNGDLLLALWNDDVAAEEDAGELVDIRLPVTSYYFISAIDILNNIEQQIVTTRDEGGLFIENLMIKDYPIILRLRPE